MAIWRMRNASWKPNATNTHSQYVILIAFPPQQWLHENASLLRSTYFAHHHAHSVFQVCASCRLLFLSKQATCSPQMSPYATLYQSFLQSLSADNSHQSLVCVLFLYIHVVMRRATIMYVYSQCWRIFFTGSKCQAVQWTRVSTRGIDEMNVRTLKRFVNFYCRCGKGLAVLPPYYVRTSCWTDVPVTLVCRQDSEGRS
jgi:hypothetical protein